MKCRQFIFLFFCLSGYILSAQDQIDYKADKIKFVKDYKGGAKRLIGHVQFTTKDGMFMTCDSSYFLDNNNIEAYSNIFIRQGDSLTITGKNAHYDGTTKLGIIDGNVVCTEKDMVLTTAVLNFDSKNKTASYQTGGTIVSKENTLTSKHGYYHSPTKTVSFRYDVKLVNPDYTMFADTLKYVTPTKTVIFLGPTNVLSKKDKLYCERGWYNTQTQISHLTKKAAIYTGKNIMYADSIHYDKKNESGNAYSNIRMIDTVQKTIISGNRSYSNKKTGIMWVTDHALLTKIMNKDSLFSTADSMFAYEKHVKNLKTILVDSITRIKKDTASTKEEKLKRQALIVKDSTNFIERDSSIIKAYHHVKIFKTDVQGVADTMVFSAYDSTLTLYHLPVLWHKVNQLSGKLIIVYFSNSKMDKIYIPENTFIISKLDTMHFNQIKGKLLWAYFKDDTLRRIDIVGNAQAVYYLQNDKKRLQGVNLIESSKLTVNEKDGTLNQITFHKKPVAKILPMRDLNVKEIEIKGFSWQDHRKPKSKADLFKKDTKLEL
ncbi:MAG TPA: OstA-like protein [Bacteroidia bacterium]|nr:OstA-like protein [Bacteroidia bacterium]